VIETIKKIIDFNYRFTLKPKLVIPIILLIIANLVLLKYSSIEKSFLFYDQIQWIIVAGIAFILFSYIRIDFIFQHSYKAYIIIFILLLLTLYFGSKFNNSQRWLSLGFMFQPSEVGKILFVFFMAKFLSNTSKNYSDSMIILITLVPTFLIMYLILKQPDLGTSLVYLFLVFPMLIWSGIRVSSVLIFISPAVSFLIAFVYELIKNDLVVLNEVYFFIFFAIWILCISFLLIKNYRGIIKDIYIGVIIIVNLLITMLTKFFWDKIIGTYWFDRVKAYLNPEEYSQDLAWQINSSYDAIGSGGLLGKGLGNGMLTEFKMMPIYESDFIIAALGEQFGLFGIFILLLLLGYFFYWLVTYLDKCLNKYEQLMLVGFTSIWFFHFFVNLCIVSGIFPVTGLPFPFLSYGGTHFLTNCIMLAIANKIISLHISN
tara:strand:- start:1196 stop:2485 length:1290 start_codon:yes stop_codon:yes gene_type:complete